MNATLASQLNLDQWSDFRWRICNLYYIVTDDGQKVKFNPNPEQLELLENLWYLNIILKARQLGFTTLICVLALDQAIFNDNYSAGIIAHTLKDSTEIFRNKIKFPYDNLPDQLRTGRTLETDTKTELVFDNGSSVRVGTSMRSGTLQFLHISEFGKICRKHPDKAREIVTGSLNTVHNGQYIFIESTAEGRGGYFYAYTQTARKLLEADAKLSQLDFRFHFFPWWTKQDYSIDPVGVILSKDDKAYFEELETKHGILLTRGQKAWYVKKAQMMALDEGKTDEDMKREFPSHPDEAFEVAIQGAYYGPQMAFLRKHKRITKVPWVPSMPVNTFWDIGRNDLNAIWFHQYVANEHRFIRYFENSGEDLAYYYKYMQDLGYIWGKHYLPHDAEHKRVTRNESVEDRLIELGLTNIEIVPRVDNIVSGIEQTRRMLPMIYIDEENCADGIKALDGYQKEYDEKLGTFKQTPFHNWASNGADAIRQFAQGWAPPARKTTRRKRRVSHKTV